MDKDLNQSTELVKKLSESQTRILISGKIFILNEMPIKKVSDFSIKIVNLMDKFEAETGEDLAALEAKDVIIKYSDIVFKELTSLFNWVFAIKNPEYTKITKAWAEENLTIRIITEIIKQIAIQNRLDWLGPFFKKKVLKNLEVELK